MRSCRSTGSTVCQDLVDACRAFPLKRRRRITFEYVLLAGVNDTPADARRLVTLLHGIKAKVNLIPLNEAAGIPFDAAVGRTRECVRERRSPIAGLTVSVRKSRGRDIRAACGQLIVEGAAPSTGQQARRRLMRSLHSRSRPSVQTLRGNPGGILAFR